MTLQQPTKYETNKAKAKSPPYPVAVAIQLWGRSLEREVGYLASIGAVPEQYAESWVRHTKHIKDAISAGRPMSPDDVQRYFNEVQEQEPAAKSLAIRRNDRRVGQPSRIAFDQYEEAIIAGYWVRLVGMDHYEVPQQLGRWRVNGLAGGLAGFDESVQEALHDAAINHRKFDNRYLRWEEVYDKDHKPGPLGLVLEGALPIDDWTMQSVMVPASKLGLIRWRNDLPDLSKTQEPVYVDMSYLDLYRYVFPNEVNFADQRDVETGDGKLEAVARQRGLITIGIVNTGGTLRRVNAIQTEQGPLYVVGEPVIESQTMVWTPAERRDDFIQEIMHDGLKVRRPDDPETVESYRYWKEEVLARNIGGARNPRPDDPQYWLRTERDVRNRLAA
ncbi:MAG: hypothetical protein HYT72_05525 [Candidatus Aenigmarchaeota archaeon]|nr:hypothetical protein [Candidatus Aenigmarchaeota archaeon]